MRGLLALLALACAQPAMAQEPALAERTRQSGLPLDPVRAGMTLPHLALGFTVDPATRSIAGSADYTVTVDAPQREVAFDLDPRFAIDGISVDGQALPPSAWRNPDGLLRITLPRSMPAGGTAQVGIRWHGAPHVAARAPWDGGMTWARTPDGQPWIASAIQGEGCDLLWPCLDHPAKRVALLDLAIRVPDGLVAAANGTLVEETHANGWATWRWRARQPNAYGVTLQIGAYLLAEASYRSAYGNIIPVQYWHLPGDKPDDVARLLAETQRYLRFFEEVVGPYPFADEKVGLAETPHLGMEHQTINAYGNGYKLAPEGYDWLAQHEFGHEWFANQMTNATDGEMWLHEGFDSYMQPLYLLWQGSEVAYNAALWDQRKRILNRVPLVPADPAATGNYLDEEAGWGNDIYYKGSWIAHTLRGLIGDVAFRQVLRRLVYDRDDPQPGNFVPVRRSSEDLARIVGEVTGADHRWFFDTYLRQAALPRLVAERDGTRLLLRWDSGAARPFAMPVEVRVGDPLTGAVRTVPMPGGRGSVDLGAADIPYRLDPAARILRDDPAITAWQAQEDAAR
ncbi:M1 family metallopeptidase [Croceibacterium sp. TMG7-5b_MA50]|uniref:M1 family metallopeptidase n=1 Tax=Croceibacterium sp. TMG7-5b_MA50 TaxID=3121290 RepID=UPI0032218993